MDNQNWNYSGQDYQGTSWQQQSQGTNWQNQGYPNMQEQYYGNSGVVNTQPVSTGEWILVYLVSMIPCVNLILLLFWSFAGGVKQSLKNYSKAMLILAIVGTILIFVLIFGIVFLATASMTY